MKAKRIIQVHDALKELVTLKLPYRAARNIQKLRTAINSEIDIIASQEEKWAKECGGKVQDDGRIEFTDRERADEYGKWRSDMIESEIETSFPECDLSACVEQITISPSALAALEGIVKFESEG